MRKLFIFVLLSSITSISHATDYFWETVNPAGGKFPSAQLACDAVHQYFVDNNQNKTPAFTKFEQMPIRRTSDTVFVCETKGYINNNGSYFLYSTWSGTATRKGTTCPPDHTFDPLQGKCDPPEQTECEKKAGTSTPFQRTGQAPDSFALVIGGLFSYNSEACFNGCLATTIDKVCTGRVNGLYGCRGNAEFTGAECGTSDAPITESDTSEPPVPEKITETTACTYITTPGGDQTCTSSEIEEIEGQNCGTVNGVPTCVDTPPSKNGIEISTTVTTTTNPDGSTTTTQTDKADVTKCSGVNSCSTTTTTNTTITNRGPGGNVTSTSGSCSGPQCPDKNTNPDGNGNGFGDCIGDSCGEEGGEFTGGELGEVATVGEATTQFMERVSDAPIMQAVAGIGLRGSGSCSFPSVSTDIGVIGLDFMCQNANWLDPLYYVFLAIWGLAAVRVLMSA